MNFLDHYSALSRDEKESLAQRLDTSVAYLSQLAHGHRRAGARILAVIETATDGAVTSRDLRPDLYPGEEAA